MTPKHNLKSQRFKTKKILIVDSNVFQALRLKTLLQGLGFENAEHQSVLSFSTSKADANLFLVVDSKPALKALARLGIKAQKVIAIQAFEKRSFIAGLPGLADVLPSGFNSDELNLRVNRFFRETPMHAQKRDRNTLKITSEKTAKINATNEEGHLLEILARRAEKTNHQTAA